MENINSAPKLGSVVYRQEYAILVSGKYILKRDKNDKKRAHLYKNNELNESLTLAMLLQMDEITKNYELIIKEENEIRSQNKNVFKKGDFNIPNNFKSHYKHGWLFVTRNLIEEFSGYLLNYRTAGNSIQKLAEKGFILLDSESRKGNHTYWKIRINFKKIYNTLVKITNDEVRLPGYVFKHDLLTMDYLEDKEPMQLSQREDEKDKKIAQLEKEMLEMKKLLIELSNSNQNNKSEDLSGDKKCPHPKSGDKICPDLKSGDKKCPGDPNDVSEGFQEFTGTKYVPNDMINDYDYNKEDNLIKKENLNNNHIIHKLGTKMIDMILSEKSNDLILSIHGNFKGFVSLIQKAGEQGYLKRNKLPNIVINKKYLITDEVIEEAIKLFKEKNPKGFALFPYILLEKQEQIMETINNKNEELKKKKAAEQKKQEEEKAAAEKLKKHPHLLWKNSENILDTAHDKELTDLTPGCFNFFKTIYSSSPNKGFTNDSAYNNAWVEYNWYQDFDNHPLFKELCAKEDRTQMMMMWASEFMENKITEKQIRVKYNLPEKKMTTKNSKKELEEQKKQEWLKKIEIISNEKLPEGINNYSSQDLERLYKTIFFKTA